LVDTDNAEMKMDLETLMAGGKISKPIHEDITYDEIGKDNVAPNDFWNILFFTGYLKKVGERRQNENGESILELSIPNIELKYVYHTKIREWFREHILKKDLDTLFRAVLDGDAETFQDELLKLLSESISYMDSAESSYHGFMTGLLSRMGGYLMTSNRECGDGRSDLVLYRVDGKNSQAIIFEFKAVKDVDKLRTASESALKQIEDKNYAAPWERENYKNIIKYGVAFCGKRCEVRNG